MRTRKITKRTLGLVLAAALMLAAGPASAVVIVDIHTSDGASGADAYVRLGQATTNFGNSSGLVIKDSGGGSTTRKGYVRFDLAGLDKSRILSATLELTVHTNNGVGAWNVNVFGLNDGDAGETWIEGNGGGDNIPAGEIVWNNAPANGSNNSILGGQTGDLADLSVGSGANAPPGTLVSVTSAHLAQFLRTDTDGLATIIMNRNNTGGNTGGNNLVFRTKEDATLGQVDEPTLRVRLFEPSDQVITFADTGFDSFTGAFNSDGTSAGPWEYARMARASGNSANAFTALVNPSDTFTHGSLPGSPRTTSGNPGNFAILKDIASNGSQRGFMFLGQRFLLGDVKVLDVAVGFDEQRWAPQSDRSVPIGLALFTTSAWEARRPDQPLLHANDIINAANVGALWLRELRGAATNSDDLDWTPLGLGPTGVGELVNVLNANTGQELVLSFYALDTWSSVQTFTYLDNFHATILYTPEPATAMLLGFGGLALARRARRRRSRGRRGKSRLAKRIAGLVVAAAALLLARGAASAGVLFSIDTTDGVGADSYVRKGNATTNFGTAGEVLVKDSGTSTTTREGYLRFDFTNLPKVLTDATLSLDVSTNNSGGGDPTPKQYTVNVFGLNDGHAGEGWIESGAGSITWNNAPANDTLREYFTNDAVFLGRFTVPAVAAPNTVTFSALALKSFLTQDTDGRASILLTREGGNNNLGFASKEHATLNAPALSGEGSFSALVISVATNDGVGADAYVRKGTATTNYGSDPQLLTKNVGSSSTTRKSYLRFDLPPLMGGVLDAALNLEVITNNQGGAGSTPQNQTVNVWGLDDLDPGELWGEGTLTWNNAPANNTANNGILGNATLLGTFLIPNHPETDSKPLEVMFTSQQLIDFINADTNSVATLILTRQNTQSGWNLAFASREHSTLMAPTLTLGLFVPEPTSLGLLALGALGLWRRRRRPRGV